MPDDVDRIVLIWFESAEQQHVKRDRKLFKPQTDIGTRECFETAFFARKNGFYRSVGRAIASNVAIGKEFRWFFNQCQGQRSHRSTHSVADCKSNGVLVCGASRRFVCLLPFSQAIDISSNYHLQIPCSDFISPLSSPLSLSLDVPARQNLYSTPIVSINMRNHCERSNYG